MPENCTSDNSPTAVHEVLQGRWHYHEGEGILFTQEITSCVGIAIYHTIEPRAFLGHFDSQSFSRDNLDLNSFFSAAKGEFQGAEELLRIWIGGSAMQTVLTQELLAFPRARELREIYNATRKVHRMKILGHASTFYNRGAALETNWLRGEEILNYSLDVLRARSKIQINNSNK